MAGRLEQPSTVWICTGQALRSHRQRRGLEPRRDYQRSSLFSRRKKWPSGALGAWGFDQPIRVRDRVLPSRSAQLLELNAPSDASTPPAAPYAPPRPSPVFAFYWPLAGMEICVQKYPPFAAGAGQAVPAPDAHSPTVPVEARCGGASIAICRRGSGCGHGCPLTPARPWIYSRIVAALRQARSKPILPLWYLPVSR
jgi:hypothetical protein